MLLIVKYLWDFDLLGSIKLLLVKPLRKIFFLIEKICPNRIKEKYV